MTSFPVNPALVAAPGTLLALHDAIKARMAVVVAAFDGFQTKDQHVQRAPTVVDGWVPPKQGANDHQYPFVLVRPSGGTDTEQSADQNSTADMTIIIGTYSDDDAGFKDLVLVIDAIRLDLGAAPTIVNTAFEQTGPLTWEIPQEQTRPEWLGQVKTKWTLPRPMRVDRNPEEG